MIHLSSLAKHEKKVKAIATRLKATKGKVALFQHVSNTIRDDRYKTNLKKIDLSSLNNVLGIDLENQFVVAEPFVTMEKLVTTCLKYKVVPLVVPEFKSITVGGAIMGAALESSSHRYGQFNDTCMEYEIILASGEIIKASEKEYRDLFFGISGSYGTLALITAAKIQLKPAKKYVKMSYSKLSSLQMLLNFFEENRSSEFLEGGGFDQDLFLGIKGELTDDKEKNHYTQKFYCSSWFITHLHKLTQKEKFQETIPLKQYLFRYDRGAFWIGLYLLSVPLILRLLLQMRLKIPDKLLQQRTEYKVPFVIRLFFGAFFSSRRMYKAWHRLNKSIREKYLIIQDFYTPMNNASEFFQTIVSKTAIFPIWFAPIKGTKTGQVCSPHYGIHEKLVDIGVYGMPKEKLMAKELTIILERENLLSGGKKMLYSFNYYDEKTFNETYGGEGYQKLREKFNGEKSFPTLYNKVCGTENIHDKRSPYSQ